MSQSKHWAKRTRKPGDKKSAWLKPNLFILLSIHLEMESQMKTRKISERNTGTIHSVLSLLMCG